MGDIVHTLPALTDAALHIPNIRFDWVVEDAFQDVPRWHTHVDQVILMSLRKWRKEGFYQHLPHIKSFIHALRQEHYDLIIDAQGLFKSAAFCWMAKRQHIAGYDFASAKESWVSLFYSKKARVPFEQHAVTRNRQLFAQSLGYPMPVGTPAYGLGPTPSAAPFRRRRARKKMPLRR